MQRIKRTAQKPEEIFVPQSTIYQANKQVIANQPENISTVFTHKSY
jgi:hypothetical protein